MRRQLFIAILWAVVAVLAFLSLWGYLSSPVEPVTGDPAPAKEPS